MRMKDLLEKIPFVSRQYHNQQIDELREIIQANQKEYEAARAQLRNKDRQHAQELEFFNELARRLMTLAVIRERKPPFDLKIEMTISPELLFQASRGGLSRQEMEMIGYRFAGMVQRELATVNLATLPDYVERIRHEQQRVDRYWSEH